MNKKDKSESPSKRSGFKSWFRKGGPKEDKEENNNEAPVPQSENDMKAKPGEKSDGRAPQQNAGPVDRKV